MSSVHRFPITPRASVTGQAALAPLGFLTISLIPTHETAARLNLLDLSPYIEWLSANAKKSNRLFATPQQMCAFVIERLSQVEATLRRQCVYKLAGDEHRNVENSAIGFDTISDIHSVADQSKFESFLIANVSMDDLAP
jgi:hypothetical protein